MSVPALAVILPTRGWITMDVSFSFIFFLFFLACFSIMISYLIVPPMPTLAVLVHILSTVHESSKPKTT